jgi:predicted nucleic acid-binding protein
VTTATTEAVLDASLYLRALMDEEETARGWIDRIGGAFRVHASELLWPEVANGLLNATRFGALAQADAAEALATVRELPIEIHPLHTLAPAALVAAFQTDLSVYDATYLVLAQALDAPLVTFDKHFVGLYDRLEFLS